MPPRSLKKRERAGESCSTRSHSPELVVSTAITPTTNTTVMDRSGASGRRAGPKRAKESANDEGAAAGGDDAPDYSSMSFWDGRYKVGVGNFDWYCNFGHVQPLFERFIRKVGCTAGDLLQSTPSQSVAGLLRWLGGLATSMLRGWQCGETGVEYGCGLVTIRP